MKRFGTIGILIALLFAGLCATVFAGSYNSGAIATNTLVYPASGTGSGTLTGVYCAPDGTHVCGCNIFDNTASSGKMLPDATAQATQSNGWFAGSVDTAPTFARGIYVVPAPNSTCFIEYELKR